MNIPKKNVYASVATVTPNDSTDLPKVASGGLYVVTGGNLVIIVGGVTVTLTGVVANSLIPLAASRVKATGTTAAVIAVY